MVIINLQKSKHRGKKDKNRIEKKANPTESPIEPTTDKCDKGAVEAIFHTPGYYT